MTAAALPAASDISDDRLITALQKALFEPTQETMAIRRIGRRPSPYQSSYPLEELTLFLDDGRQLELIFKNVSPRALSPAARRAKPSFLADPRREINIYRILLADAEHGTPRYYGSVIDPDDDRYWLFVENVSGQELYQIGEAELWLAAARWLARFHNRFARRAELTQELEQTLVRCDEAYYSLWFHRAVKFAGETGNASRLAAIQRLAALAPRIVGELLELPMTFIHGEFYASNVIINDSGNPPRICPIDWERAAIGPGLIDLAALIAGDWSEETKRQMAAAYRDELHHGGGAAPSAAQFVRGLNLCRLHLAVQWLGWSADWTPPQEHRHDWLAEAVAAAEELGFTV